MKKISELRELIDREMQFKFSCPNRKAGQLRFAGPVLFANVTGLFLCDDDDESHKKKNSLSFCISVYSVK